MTCAADPFSHQVLILMVFNLVKWNQFFGQFSADNGRTCVCVCVCMYMCVCGSWRSFHNSNWSCALATWARGYQSVWPKGKCAWLVTWESGVHPVGQLGPLCVATHGWILFTYILCINNCAIATKINTTIEGVQAHKLRQHDNVQRLQTQDTGVTSYVRQVMSSPWPSGLILHSLDCFDFQGLL